MYLYVQTTPRSLGTCMSGQLLGHTFLPLPWLVFGEGEGEQCTPIQQMTLKDELLKFNLDFHKTNWTFTKL